jgi:netrin-G3 ligand
LSSPGYFIPSNVKDALKKIIIFLTKIDFAFPQKMYATSPYSDPVVSMDLDPQPITDEEEGLIWVVGPVLAVVFIICIVIAILLYKR